MRRTFIKVATAAATLALVGAACGSGGGDDATPSGRDTKGSANTVESGAATLRASLTSLLQEHVYLAGTATGTALSTGLDSKMTRAAVETLDANSVALAGAVGSVYGTAAGDQFLELWRKHIGFFVDYTKGKATGDTALANKAKSELDGYRADFGAFLASANPNLTKQAVADSLVPHVTTLFAAIDAQVAKDPNAIAKLKAAADVMPAEADLLATAIVAQFPDKFSGATDSGPAALRTGLTALLQEHVYLAGGATGTALGTGLDSKSTQAAVATLDANSVALSKAIGSVYGAPAGDQFLELWRKHIGFFVDYTKGKATGDTAMANKAKSELDGYRADFGAFLASANPNLTKQAVADSLVPHVSTLFTAIDAQVAKDPDMFSKLRSAAGVMPAEANLLAGAIATQFPDKF